MIVRILAALWLAATIWSLVAGLRLVLRPTGPGIESRLSDFLASTSRIGKWQLRLSLLLAAAIVQRFFANELNTTLWPWSTVAWAALFLQLLFLRPHLSGYIDIVRRGFDRPIGAFTSLHLGLDVIVVATLVTLTVAGLR